ncbi:TPA: response regulator transcription factor [Enterobacter cloacae]|uniref:LuxR C-terminal-related transcriptional regulator n=1 Tax=Enterobacter cloacae TaxID=550 RepID=UPI002295A26E|nr:LuxR C-terminal-related transcriptional regulator [Enterobacter cloacae]HAS1182152.1 response regulator transcription factor [Enterobacter cloacae]HCT7896356.1 response regulator transcription factor [Enterobacter cloacae]
MSITFLSDNYYLCAGASCANIRTEFIKGIKDIDIIHYANPACHYVVAIEQDLLRNMAIWHLKKSACRYVVLLKEIEQDHHVKIDGIIYSSLRFTLEPFKRMLHVFNIIRSHHLTRREYDVLKLSHLENHAIARELNLSAKTTSTYRIKIQEKLNMRTKNMLSMHRIKSAIVDQRFKSE